MESVLKISKMGFPPWSLRDAHQKIGPIAAPVMRRTINGTLVSIAPPTHRKYATLITCQDKQGPAMDDIWVGDAVEVACIQPFIQAFCTDTLELSRPAVTGSIRAYDQTGASVGFVQEGQILRLQIPAGITGYVSYRPLLQMRLKSFQLHNHEWDLQTAWQMDLEEI